MSALTEDPAVATWRITLAPRPRHTTNGRHWWRELVTDTYRAARAAWEQGRESGQSIGHTVAGGAHSAVAAYQLSDDEYAGLFPPPTFRDALEQLSSGRVDLYGLGAQS